MCSETANYSESLISYDDPYIQKKSHLTYNIDNNLAMYIPNIDANYGNEHFIRETFLKLNIGFVESVFFHSNVGEMGETWDLFAYVIMKEWYNNIIVEHLQEKIIDEDQHARIVYDDPSYWLLLPYIKPNTTDDNSHDEVGSLHNYVIESNSGILERIAALEERNKELESVVANVTHLEWWTKYNEQEIIKISSQMNSLNSDISNDGSTSNWKRRLRPRTIT